MKYTRTIDVPNSCLTHNFIAECTKIVDTLFNNKCTSNGYMTNVSNIRVIETKVNQYSGSLIATVSFTASVLKPTVGQTVNGVVDRVIPKGVFVKHDYMSVFVPDCKFKCGEHVNISIQAIKYDTNKFNCIGKLID